MSEAVPGDLKYSRTHEWVRETADGVVVGITHHAQEQLGDLVFVELPEAGTEVSPGEACAVVESVKAASDVYAPVAGEVVEANAALGETPELVNSDPYGEGWLFRLRPSGQSGDLMDAAAYQAFIESEEH